LTELPAEIFEPHESPVKTNKNRAFGPEFEVMLARWDDFRTFRWLGFVEKSEMMLQEIKEMFI